MTVRFYCDECLAELEVPLDPESGEVTCPNGHPVIAFHHQIEEKLRCCSRCAGTAFFAQKDFDQRLGCLILVIGAATALVVSKLVGGLAFVPVLLLFALGDYFLAQRVGTVVICYRCDSEYRGLPDAATFKAYDPHIAERYAKVKTVRRMNP